MGGGGAVEMGVDGGGGRGCAAGDVEVGVEEAVEVSGGRGGRPAGGGVWRLLRSRPPQDPVRDAEVGRLAPDMRGPSGHRCGARGRWHWRGLDWAGVGEGIGGGGGGGLIYGLERVLWAVASVRGRPVSMLSPQTRGTPGANPLASVAASDRLAFDAHAPCHSSPPPSLQPYPSTASSPPQLHCPRPRVFGRRLLRRRRHLPSPNPLKRRRQPAVPVRRLLSPSLS